MSMTRRAVLAGFSTLNQLSRFVLMTDSILRFGYAADFAPFTHKSETGARGRLIELMEAALSQTRLRAQFVEITGSDVITSLADGSIDAFLPAAISPLRHRHVRFSRPLATTGGA